MTGHHLKPALFCGSVAAFALLVTACQERSVLILPPADLATCADEPAAPEIPAATTSEAQAVRDTAVLGYILALRAAGGDCRAKVKGLAEWRAEAG